MFSQRVQIFFLHRNNSVVDVSCRDQSDDEEDVVSVMNLESAIRQVR